ncbi:cobalamin biosynthesis protein [Coleofasciculus sp. LEGE 07092]|nr:cobalamin biosynthesis protein [Coleofasciculus sp. LEGE 07081]MBE9147349.1 cobalamin biosynthesis protein [Coleofasciculus sp. LEGE 07092]
MTTIVLLIAASLDFLIGDPWGWLHPVQVMGWIISRCTQWIINNCHSKWQERLGGIGVGLGVIIGSGLMGWLIVRGASWLHPVAGIAVEGILLASCFAGRSLRAAAVDVLQPLTTGQLKEARLKLSQYVGRDTEKLSEPEIFRAVLETVTENATDGVTAPLFYAILGAFFPVVGSVPLALGYKAASTLDSMIGYRHEPYQDLGWFSARLEDFLTWLPCRLTVLTLAFVSGKPGTVLNVCRRDASKDSSPNSGWSECAYAVILEVQVGGTNWYQGIAKYKPLLGDAVHPITPATINQALQLTRYCVFIWLALAIALLVLSS